MEAEALVEGWDALGGRVDRTAVLEDVFRREYDAMMRLAYLITGSTKAAEDVVQESFVRLCRHWERAAQPGAYLRTVVVSRCRSWQRRRVLERPAPAPPARTGGGGQGPGTARCPGLPTADGQVAGAPRPAEPGRADRTMNPRLEDLLRHAL